MTLHDKHESASLDQEIENWIKSLRRAGIRNDHTLDELGDHLQLLILQFMKAGHDLNSSVQMATQKIGSPESLFEEFSKNEGRVTLQLPLSARLTILASIPPMWFFLMSDMLENIVGRPTNGSTFWAPVELPLGFVVMILTSFMIIRRVEILRVVVLAMNFGLMFLYGVMFILMFLAGLQDQLQSIWKLDPVLFATSSSYFTFTTIFGILFAATVYVAYALTRPYLKTLFSKQSTEQRVRFKF